MNKIKHVISLLIICLLFFCSQKEQAVQSAIPQRIISLAPSITETLFALGLGNKVIGVTRYCTYPPQVKSLPHIGGYTDANLEMIVALKPDLVILQKEHVGQRTFFNRQGIKTLSVYYGNVAEICSSFSYIGKTCGAKKEADSLISQFNSIMRIDSSSNTYKPSVLLCIGREGIGSGNIQGVFAAGAGSFYNQFIVAAGGRNAFTDTVPGYPKLSMEGLITIAPEIIIDLASAMGEYDCDKLVNDWKKSELIPAVKNGKVFCLSADYATVPGPRIIRLVEEIKMIIKREWNIGVME